MISFEQVLHIVIVIVVGVVSLKLKILERTGFVTAIFLGTLIMIFGGWKWFVLLLSFLLVAGLFTKYKYQKKVEMNLFEIRGGARAWQNVLSNGAMAAILSCCYRLTSLKIFAVAYLGAVSTALADTLATELGLLNIDEPRLITNLHEKVRAGVSGGVTILGELAALLGSSILALVAFIVGFEDLSITQILVFNILIGILGCNFDSLLGAIVQATFKCQVCGQLTERSQHCDRPTEYYKGIKSINNNVVNLASTIFGVFIAAFLYSYVK